MKVEEVKDKIKVLIEKENLEKRIDELALEIQNDYLNKDILVICIFLLQTKLFMNEITIQWIRIST